MIIPLHSSPQRNSRRWGASSAVRWAAKKQTCCCCKLLMDSYHVHKRTYFLVLELQFLSLRVWEFTQLVNMWLTRSYVMNAKRGHMNASVLSPSPIQPLPPTTIPNVAKAWFALPSVGLGVSKGLKVSSSVLSGSSLYFLGMVSPCSPQCTVTSSLCWGRVLGSVLPT